MARDACILPARDDEAVLSAERQANYRKIVGELMYLSQCTHPDISYAVGILARSLHEPTERHENPVKKALRYMGTSAELRLVIQKNGANKLEACSDVDWTGCIETR